LPTYDHTTGVWTVGTVNVGAPQTLTITAQVIAPNPGVNTASVGHSDVFDPNPNNNSNSASVNPQEADLALSKTVDNPTPSVGDTVAYTLTLTDTGPSAATNVQVTDLLPAGLTFVNAAPSEGSYNAATGVWTVGTVTTTTTQTLTITARVASPNPQTNTANITHSDQFDPDTNNNSGSATLTPQQADLFLSKTVDNPTPNVGDTVTFTVTLANNGPNTATDVAVNDLLPAGLAFVSAAPSQGMYENTSGVWTVGTLDSSAPAQLLIRATVVSPQQQTNTAKIGHSDQFDPNPGNNRAGATTTPQQADLVVGKSVSNPTPNVGDTITYTVTVANDGPNIATGVTLLDILPPQVGFQSSLASEGSYVPNTNTWTVGSVGVGATQTLTITVLVTSLNPQANTASISHADQFDPDPANNTDTASINPQHADLELTKFVSDPAPNVGDTVNFIIALTNNGPNDATGVAVTDLLPAGLTFVLATPSQGSYNKDTGIWTVGTVTTTAAPILQIQAKVVSPNAETNTATVNADQFDPDPGNNSAGATVTPQQPDLAVTKTVDNTHPNVGDVITYTVTLANLGPDPAAGVTVEDVLPAGVKFVSATPSEGTYNPTTGVWAVGPVATTTAETLVVAARVILPGATTNTATITHSDQFDPDLSNNSSGGLKVEPLAADLAVAKDVNNLHPNVGDAVTFTVTLTDNGPEVATNVTVQDSLPAGLAFVSAMPSQGTYNPATGVWAVGPVGTLFARTLKIVAVVQSAAPLTNTAAISHSDEFDPNPDNDSASVTVNGVAPPLPPLPPLPEADLTLTKEVSQTTPIFGTPVMFTLIVHNNGPDPAIGVVAADALPAGVIFLSATPSQGLFHPGSGQWAIGTLANGATVTLQITGLVATVGPITNVASVLSLDVDPNLANNISAVTINGMFSPAQISKALFLSSSNSPLNAATLAAEEALFNELVPIAVNMWDRLLSVAQSVLAARNDPGPGNGGIPVFEGNWLGSPLVVYANPFAGQVTAVQVSKFDLLYENNAVAAVRML
jgi:uncharacterized repeat protein (TIGR01451 family)